MRSLQLNQRGMRELRIGGRISFARLPLNFLCRFWDTPIKSKAPLKNKFKTNHSGLKLRTLRYRDRLWLPPESELVPKQAVQCFFPTLKELFQSFYQYILLCRLKEIIFTLLGYVLSQGPKGLMYVNFCKMFPQSILTMSDWDSKVLLNYIQVPIKSQHWQEYLGSPSP